jgi:hypothetical protein
MKGRSMDAVLADAERRGRAVVRRDWDAVAAQLHKEFRNVTANGSRLDRGAYPAFLADFPVQWKAQTLF